MAAGHDFSEARAVVDVGGGRGILLAEILRGNPHLQGTLLRAAGLRPGPIRPVTFPYGIIEGLPGAG